MGKKITFIGFLLALLCLLPPIVYKVAGAYEAMPQELALASLVGFPLFSLVSFLGMMIWLVREVRSAKAEASKGDNPRETK